MASDDATIETKRSSEETFDYVATFSNAAEWDSGVAAGEALDSGPPGVVLGRIATSISSSRSRDPRRVVLRAVQVSPELLLRLGPGVASYACHPGYLP